MGTLVGEKTLHMRSRERFLSAEDLEDMVSLSRISKG